MHAFINMLNTNLPMSQNFQCAFCTNWRLCHNVFLIRAAPGIRKNTPLEVAGTSMKPSMENFHLLRRTPSHVDVLNSVHCCAEFAQGCAELGAQEIKKLHQIYCICLRKIFCWPFFSYFKILLTFFSNFPNFCWPFFASLAIFLTFLA